MIVRQRQIRTLAAESEERSAASAARHLETYDPLLAAAAGKAGLQRLAGEGIPRAREYGFTAGNHLQLFLEMLMSFGNAFDTDPQYRWLRPFLDPAEGSPAERASLLHFHAVSYLDRAFGERGALGLAALERGENLNVDRLARIAGSLRGRAPELLQWLHPERLEFLEPGALDELVDTAWKTAAGFGLDMPTGAALLLVLQFTFGHGVHEDPVHPWLRKMLEEQSDGKAKVEQIGAKANTYVQLMRRRLSERIG
ncbi:MAG: hypothetical protein U0Q16_09010 [Bryobacteraceae bacterium]